MLNVIRYLCSEAGTSVVNGEVTINDKDLHDHFPELPFWLMNQELFKLKRSRCVRLDSEFIGDDIYHIKEGDTVYHIKLLKNSIYH